VKDALEKAGMKLGWGFLVLLEINIDDPVLKNVR